MSAPRIMLDCLPSLCQQLSDLVEVSRSYNKIILLVFFLRHGVLFIIFWPTPVVHGRYIIKLEVESMQLQTYSGVLRRPSHLLASWRGLQITRMLQHSI